MSKKCLIVDDVEVSRYVLRGHVEDLGFTVIESEDAEHAEAALMQGRFDIILLDWHLRHDSGLTFIEKIRKIEGALNVPIVVCSGVEQGDLLAVVKESGAQGFLKKPVSQEALSSELKRLGLF
ncbi:MAG: response regulator [Alphaproteobacteria bacterium]|nr:response regulator [Alphaproteobacteria bacterium]